MKRTWIGVVTAAVVTSLAVTAQSAAAGSADWRDVVHPEVSVNLEGVAAVSRRTVWAVGARWTPDGMVGYSERWNGRAWRETVLPGPAYHTFTDVSASSTRDVWVLADTHGQGQLFKHWDGRVWAEVAPATLPGHPGYTVLRDVSAVSRNNAWAVGFHTQNYPYESVVQRWDGSRWSRVPTPDSMIALQAVSARAADDVWAVGWRSQDDPMPLAAMHWNGQTWRTFAIPAPGGRQAQLMDVVAVSSGEVWAAGNANGAPVAMRWDGARWHVLPIPEMETVHIDAVAPDGRGGVWVAGYDYSDDEPGSSPLYLHWDGASWIAATSEQPEGAVTALTALRPRARTIWAVGTTSWCPCFVGQPLVQVHGRLPALTGGRHGY
jgi:hypothetical protein